MVSSSSLAAGIVFHIFHIFPWVSSWAVQRPFPFKRLPSGSLRSRSRSRSRDLSEGRSGRRAGDRSRLRCPSYFLGGVRGRVWLVRCRPLPLSLSLSKQASLWCPHLGQCRHGRFVTKRASFVTLRVLLKPSPNYLPHSYNTAASALRTYRRSPLQPRVDTCTQTPFSTPTSIQSLRDLQLRAHRDLHIPTRRV